jgi:octaprenyl-diphosphate synthase
MESLTHIARPVQEELSRFSDLYEGVLSSSNPLIGQVFDHLRSRKGKQMRPLLVLLVARLLGEVNDCTYHAAVSLELLHAASLVHDDIVDEADERRSRPSVNASFGNKVAVLSGDYLLATSLKVASLTASQDLITLIAGLGQNLSDGELLQLHHVGRQGVSEDTYFEIIRKKTAALFSACAESAAYSVGASQEQRETVALLGEYIGTCFQIRDDIFDYFPQGGIGKPTGKDLAEGKLTLPVLYAYTQGEGGSAYAPIVQRIKDRQASPEDIQTLIDFTLRSGGIEYAEQRMQQLGAQAKALLADFPPSAVRTALEAYTDYVITRTS